MLVRFHRQGGNCYGAVAAGRQISQTSTGKLGQAETNCYGAVAAGRQISRTDCYGAVANACQISQTRGKLLWCCSSWSSDLTDKHRQAQTSLSDIHLYSIFRFSATSRNKCPRCATSRRSRGDKCRHKFSAKNYPTPRVALQRSCRALHCVSAQQ